MKKTFIIDGNSLINRAFYALPMLTNSKGQYLNAVYGFTNILVKMIRENNPDYIVVAFDIKAPTFRHKLYKEYKGNRKKMPDELAEQIPMLKNLLQDMNIKTIEKEGFEADDIIGLISTQFNTKNIILTGDKDSFQLINDNTNVWFTKKGISQIEEYDKDFFFQEYGFTPDKMIDFKALMGDASDNIPGVPGVGQKTALKLIQEKGSIDNIYKNINEYSGKLKQNLLENKDTANKSKKLVEIVTDFDVDINLEDCKYRFPFSSKVYKIFQEYGFKSLIRDDSIFQDNIGNDMFGSDESIKVVEICNEPQLEKFVKFLSNNKKPFSFIILKDIHISNGDQETVVKLKKDLISDGLDLAFVLSKFKPVLEDRNIEKILFNYKKSLREFKQYNIKLSEYIFDILIGKYLVSGSEKQESQIEEFFKSNGLSLKYAGMEIFRLKSDIYKHLEEFNMKDLYFNIELKLAKILYHMEKTGFNVDYDMLRNLNDKYMEIIQELTGKIHAIAGEKFNINSPKQLAEILFDKLDIKAYNNKKRSTGASVLEKIKGKHEIVDLIIKYRHISKLSNTYLDSIGRIIDKNSTLVHTDFNQVLTTTGRLSSSNPNLQNIPIKTPEGRELRKMFISKFDEGILVSADYSQIELRLLAHYSGDAKLIEAYNENLDIHTQTASEIFNIPIEDVDSSARRDAKAVNFGIIYGISDYGLSQNIGGTRIRSRDYIDKYFNTYKGVKKFMDSSVLDAKDKGYVTTLMGRRRHLPDINSKSFFLRQASERAAMNMPLQGSASDIIKLAMIKVFNRLKSSNMKSQLVLQVHDEIIVDTYKGEVEKVKNILREEMQDVIKLKIPLTIEVSEGVNLFEAH